MLSSILAGKPSSIGFLGNEGVTQALEAVQNPAACQKLSDKTAHDELCFSDLARDVAPYNVTINNLLPGQFETDRLVSNHERFALASGQTVEEFQSKSKRGIPAGSFGQPQEFGAYAAFLCGASAGFVTGQNLLLDGGQYPGIM